MTLDEMLALAKSRFHEMRVYGAWLFRGEWDGKTPPPMEGWKLRRMVPGRFQEPPEGFQPGPGMVTLLGQGDTVIVVTPD